MTDTSDFGTHPRLGCATEGRRSRRSLLFVAAVLTSAALVSPTAASARSVTGASSTSAPTSVAVEATASGIGAFLALAPHRLLDTRANGVKLAAGLVQTVPVVGANGVPGDAVAVVLNVTATGSAAAGYATVFPCGTAVPDASNLNFAAGATIANSVIATIGDGGSVCVFSSATLDLIVDLNGAFTATGAAWLTPLAPRRLLDTRAVGAKRPAGSVQEILVAGANGVPADAVAAVLNVTATGTTGPGYVSVFPCGTSIPDVSNVNFATNETIANSVMSTIGIGGKVCVYTSATIDLIVDVNGAFTPTSTARLSPLAPRRLLDTRSSAKVAAGAVQQVLVAGTNGVPASAVAAVLNVTATGTDAGAGYVTVYPCGTPVPDASNLNFSAGETIANSVTTTIGTGGKVCLFTSAAIHLLVDLNGAYVHLATTAVAGGIGLLNVGTSMSVTLTADGSPAPTFINSAGMPAGLSLNATTGVISGTPTTGGAYTFTVTATNDAGHAAATFAGTVTQAPSTLTTTLLQFPKMGLALGATVTSTGTPRPTLTITAGAMPGGLAFNAATGAITGTPTGGTYSFTVNAANTVGSTSRTFSGTVTGPPSSLTVTGSIPANAPVGTAITGFSVSSTALQAPTYSVTGNIPTGLLVNATSGALTGAPTTPGTYSFSIVATNAVAPSQSTSAFNVLVGRSPTFVNSDPIDFKLNVAASVRLFADGSPAPTFAVTSGALPTPLLLNTTTGVISGTPNPAGPYSFVITVTNVFGSFASSSFAGNVTQTPTAPVITGLPLTVTLNDVISATVASTATPTPTLTVLGLPSGLSFDGTTIAGTATPAGDYSLTATATNAVGTSAPTLRALRVQAAPSVQTITLSAPTASVGDAVTGSLSASAGFPLPTYTKGAGFPPGMSLNAGSGAITGAPTASNVYTFTVIADNGVGSPVASDPVTLTVNGPPTSPVVSNWPTNGLLLNADVSALNVLVTSTGTPTPSLNVTGSLPSGMSFDPSTGSITGTASPAGVYPVTFTSSNGVGGIQSTPFTFTVREVPSVPVVSGLSSPTSVGNTASGTVSSAFGTPMPTYLLAGTFPPGMTVSSSGVIGGVLTTSGVYTFTFTASNGVDTPAVSSAPVTVTVNGPPSAPVVTPTGSLVVLLGATATVSVTSTGTPTPVVSLDVQPGGLTFLTTPGDSTSGSLTGTTSVAGVFHLTFTATNASGFTTTPFTLTVQEAPSVPVVTLATEVTINAPLTGAVHSSTGTPDPTYAKGPGFPAGLTLNTITGAIGGAPTTAGEVTFTVTASNGVGLAVSSDPFVLTVDSPPSNPVVSGLGTDGFVGAAVDALVTSTGTPTPTLSASGVPPGLTFNPNDGSLTGDPTVPGVYDIIFTATNGITPNGVTTVRFTVH